MGQVPAAERTVAVLQHLAGQARPVTASSVARALGLPRSSTYHLLATLAEARFVVHLPEERRWGLGVGAFELGQAFLRDTSLERLARPLLHRLAHDTHIATHLAIIDARDVVYLVAEHPPATVPLVVDVGVRLPAHLTASGRALLAAMTDTQVRATYPDRSSLPRRTGIGPTSPTALRRVLERVRRDGIGREDGEIDRSLSSVAAVAVDHSARPAAAVTLTFRSADHDGTARDRLAAAARATAHELTARLGGDERQR